ncbi:hypothetical protein ACWEN6_13745 [Sphaerisporangium sp. NPDC004334]
MSLNVDSTLIRAHLQALRDAGMSFHEISAASRVERATLHRIYYGRHHRVRPRTARRVLAIAPAPGQMCIDATGTRRRVQAMTADGWTGRQIARLVGARTGHHRTDVNRLATAETVTAVLAEAVRGVYVDLFHTAPPDTAAARKARQRATTQRWAPSAAWDDTTIDDPGAEPDWSAVACMHCDRCVVDARRLCRPALEYLAKHGTLEGLSRKRNGRDLAEEARRYARMENYPLAGDHANAGVEHVAQWLGVPVSTLEKALERHPAEVAS